MLTPTQRTILATELAKAEYAAALAQQDYPGIAATLNARATIANPTPVTQKSRRVPFEEFIGVLTPADVQLLYSTMPTWAEEYRRAQQAGDGVVARKLWNGAKRLAFNAATITAIDALQAATEADPAYSPTILAPSRATVLGLPVVEARDVQAIDAETP